jgi:chromosome segregation ATPase
LIESIMVFALGFLSAGLLALIILPAVNRRAERLAKRRYEALFPLSAGELAAERDHLRAEFAVATRRLEQRLERVTLEKGATLEESGRRAFTIRSLEDEVASQKASVADAQKRVAEIEATLAGAHETLSANERTLSETRDKLAATEAELSLLSDDHTRALEEVDGKGRQVADLESRNALLSHKLDDTERTLGARIAVVTSELAERIAEIATERADRAAEITTERAGRAADRAAALDAADARERSLVQERNEFAAMRDRLGVSESLRADRERRIAILELSEADLAKRLTEATLLLERRQALVTKHETVIAELERKIADLEARHAAADGIAKDEQRSLAARADVLDAEKESLKRSLEEARADLSRLQREVHVRDRPPAAARGSDAIETENAALRARIEEVASDILRLVGGEALPKPRAKRQA